MHPTTRHIVQAYTGGSKDERADTLAVEEPLEIVVRANGGEKTVAVTMRTPGHDGELALGFLFSEGLLNSDAKTTVELSENRSVIGVSEKEFEIIAQSESLNRYSFVNSSCGVCGRTSIDDLRQRGFRRVDSEWKVPSALITALPEKLRAAQSVFDQTGGLHAAGWFDEKGDLLCLREDVGRHNAVDKIIGWMVSEKYKKADRSILMVSGRLSYEIVQKSLSAGLPIIAAVSAPSNLAVKIGHEFNLTLIGFLRGDRFNVYTHPERVTSDSI